MDESKGFAGGKTLAFVVGLPPALGMHLITYCYEL